MGELLDQARGVTRRFFFTGIILGGEASVQSYLALSGIYETIWYVIIIATIIYGLYVFFLRGSILSEHSEMKFLEEKRRKANSRELRKIDNINQAILMIVGGIGFIIGYIPVIIETI